MPALSKSCAWVRLRKVSSAFLSSVSYLTGGVTTPTASKLIAPAGSFGTNNTVYLRMLGASLSARESEGLSLPPGQQKNEDHLNPSSILAKIPVVEGKAIQFQSPFLLYSSNSLTSHNLGHFTLQVGDAEGTPFGDIVDSVWEPGSDGSSAAHTGAGS